MNEPDANPTESATPYKLEQARDKGSVARSTELTAAAILAAMTMVIYACAWSGVKQALRLQQTMLALIGHGDWSAQQMMGWIGQCLFGILHILSPLFLAVAATAIVVMVLQSGPVFSLSVLAPDPQRISPTAGLKRLFSLRVLYETGKSLVKLCLLVAVAWWAIGAMLPGLMALSATEPRAHLRIVLALGASLVGKLVLALALVALIDLVYSRWEFAKRMRMSRRDIKDESKNREGDPRIRARLRELRREMLKRSKAVRKLPSADVLITNPTHLAVALRYDPASGAAPQLVAKGAGEMAARMRALAGVHRIPIVQNKALARAIYKQVDYEGYVPEQFYGQLAKIMVWVHVLRQQRLDGGR